MNMKEEELNSIPSKSAEEIRNESKNLQAINGFNNIFLTLIKKISDLTPTNQNYYNELFNEVSELIKKDSLLLIELWRESIEKHKEYIGDMTKENQKYLIEHAHEMGIIEDLHIHHHMLNWSRDQRKIVFDILKGLKLLSSFYHKTGLEMICSIEKIAQKVIDPNLIQQARHDPLSTIPNFINIVPDLIMQDPQMIKNIGKIIKQLENRFENQQSDQLPNSLLDSMKKFMTI